MGFIFFFVLLLPSVALCRSVVEEACVHSNVHRKPGDQI